MTQSTPLAAPDGASWTETDRRLVDTARLLALDAVERVGNGHPGTAMSLAPAATLLFQRFLEHDPSDPDWTGRDRFVLSCGHSSLTLYVQLYLSGYGLELDDLKSRVLLMGGIVEQQMRQAMQGLYEADQNLLTHVEQGDSRLDDAEVQLDTVCNQIIAKRTAHQKFH